MIINKLIKQQIATARVAANSLLHSNIDGLLRLTEVWTQYNPNVPSWHSHGRI